MANDGGNLAYDLGKAHALLEQARDALTTGPVRWLVPERHGAEFRDWLDRVNQEVAPPRDPRARQPIPTVQGEGAC